MILAYDELKTDKRSPSDFYPNEVPMLKCFTELQPGHSFLCWIMLQDTDNAAGVLDRCFQETNYFLFQSALYI